MHTYARFACNILRACVPPDRRAATECCKSYRTQRTLAHLRCICARVYVYVVNDACAHTHAARVCVRACVLALGFVCGFNGMHPHAHGTSESIVNAPASRTSAARVRFIIVRAEFDTSQVCARAKCCANADRHAAGTFRTCPPRHFGIMCFANYSLLYSAVAGDADPVLPELLRYATQCNVSNQARGGKCATHTRLRQKHFPKYVVRCV